MSLDLTSLFTRLGHIIYTTTTSLNTFRGSVVPARILLTEGDYADPDLNLIDGINGRLASWQSANNGLVSYLRSLAQSTVIQMVNDAVPQADKSLGTALAYVAARMAATSATIQRNAVAGSASAGGSNTGNGALLVGLLDANGLPMEFVFPESIVGTCTSDSQSGGATSGQETFTFRGQFAVNDPMSWLFPAGSGSAASLQAIDASSDDNSGTRNQLFNGNFETWTVANIPDGWHIGTGTAGTSVFQSTAQHYVGASSLRFLGDGSELTSVYTAFGVDFTEDASALDQLAVNLWLKVDSVPAAGVLTVQLVDGSNVQINDDAGNASSFTISLPGATTSFVAHGGFLRTPRVLPAVVRLRLKLTTALSNTVNLYIDRVSLARPVQAYQGGPVLALFSGSTPFIAGDTFTVAVTNDQAGLIHSGANRLLGLRQLGIAFPSVASSPSISDGLVS